ncbi:MAG: hypothetical protein EU549_00465 [Promethearchaeota archaeon]|nr:MAG: hypothetical protein EU549_00465 [Candidatus Lokiarchaeota archaeon]
MKQSKLFSKKEKDKKSKELKEKKHQEAIERKKDFQKHMKMHHKKNLEPKKQYYTCECGLIMHWKVAWGRRDGCPQCNRKVKKEDLFVIYD